MSPEALAGERFRALHGGAGPLILPNPGDAGTARLLEQAGFKALATTSAGSAFSLGLEDGGLKRETAMRHVAEIAEATFLPVSADLGTGFGRDPQTVAETIRLAASCGAVGGSIEDRSCDPRDPLLPISLAAERIAAAAEAARALDFPFMLTARAENFLVGSTDLDDVLLRLEAYRDAGADVLYAPSLPDGEAIASVVEVAGGTPVNVLAQGKGPTSSIAQLSALGVRRISLGSALTRLAFTAILRGIDELRSGRLDFLDDAVSVARMNDLFSAGSDRRAGGTS
jgi:2-methylisocitrate lyase-like PEP mutase family enzyme